MVNWKGFFSRPALTRDSRDPHSGQAREPMSVEPTELLSAHADRIGALRLESGYPADEFNSLIGTAIARVAEYVHVLPATRAENHSETGGLLRFALEIACVAFRSADGKFLSGPVATDIHHRKRDRAWRYAAFLGGLLRPLGRCATDLQVFSMDGGTKIFWNPYQEGLWSWRQRQCVPSVEIAWSRTDARPSHSSSVWIAARIVTSEALTYLQRGDDTLPELLLQLIGGGNGRVCELVDKAYQAVIEQDLAALGTTADTAVAGMKIEYRLLDALRRLVREKWSLNVPGGRLWLTAEGLFIFWKPACNDLVVRLKADGVSGIPRDPDTIAELLIAHGVLRINPGVINGLRHYYHITPKLRGVPKQSIQVVKVADTDLIGASIADAVPVELEGADGPPPEKQTSKKSGRAVSTLELPFESAPASATGPAARQTDGTPPVVSLRIEHSTEMTAESGRLAAVQGFQHFDRFGDAGKMLKALAERLRDDPGFTGAVPVNDGVAIAYPDALAALSIQPQEFLAACEAQSVLVTDKTHGGRVLHTRAPGQTDLPEHYVVLTARVAKYLPLRTS